MAMRFGLLMRSGSGGGSSSFATPLRSAPLIQRNTQLSFNQLSLTTTTPLQRPKDARDASAAR